MLAFFFAQQIKDAIQIPGLLVATVTAKRVENIGQRADPAIDMNVFALFLVRIAPKTFAVRQSASRRKAGERIGYFI